MILFFAYHCVTGIDKTSILYAINQMCNTVYYNRKKKIIEEINKVADGNHYESINNFFEFVLIKYFKPRSNDLIPTDMLRNKETFAPASSVPGLQAPASSVPGLQAPASSVPASERENINLLEYYLHQSFLLSWFLTGVPGLKYDSDSISENRFAYLITHNKVNAKMFEGYSKLRIK